MGHPVSQDLECCSLWFLDTAQCYPSLCRSPFLPTLSLEPTLEFSNPLSGLVKQRAIYFQFLFSVLENMIEDYLLLLFLLLFEMPPHTCLSEPA